MLRPLLLAFGCFLLFPPGVVGEKKEITGEIASLLNLLGKNDFAFGDSRMIYSFAVIITVLFVLILIALLFFLIYKICIEHQKLTFLCNVSPSDFTGRGQWIQSVLAFCFNFWLVGTFLSYPLTAIQLLIIRTQKQASASPQLSDLVRIVKRKEI